MFLNDIKERMKSRVTSMGHKNPRERENSLPEVLGVQEALLKKVKESFGH